jgi:ABC-2 type transport system permease protein
VIAADVRAFGAAALKEWRQLRRYPTFFLGGIFWPILLPAVYVVQARAFSGGDARALDAFAARTGTADVAGFVFVGWAMYMWLSVVLWGPGTALRTEQVRGSLEAVLLTPASRVVPLFGPATAHLVPAAWSFAVIGFGLWWLFGTRLELSAVLRAIAVAALTIPAMYGIGALFATIALRFGEIGGLVQMVRGVFTLCCGVTFPIVLLPEWARAFALALPPTYFVADARAVLLAGADLVDVLPDLAILTATGIVACILAVIAFRITEASARRVGMLGRY